MALALKREAPAQPTAPARPRRRSTHYLLKRALLGRPLATARLEHERLGKPTALEVFSSDNMSSVAYATEEIRRGRAADHTPQSLREVPPLAKASALTRR
jgi:hypothetical protein